MVRSMDRFVENFLLVLISSLSKRWRLFIFRLEFLFFKPFYGSIHGLEYGQRTFRTVEAVVVISDDALTQVVNHDGGRGNRRTVFHKLCIVSSLFRNGCEFTGFKNKGSIH